jgi:HSP20 family protein
MATERKKAETAVTVWQPFRDLENMERRWGDFFGRSVFPSILRRLTPDGMGLSPAVEITEEDERFTVRAELPGVSENDVNVTVAGDMLTIEGEKKAESEVKKKGYYYSEASYGSFSRSINLPSSVNADKIEANFDKGVLVITLPKAAEAKPKKIALSKKTGTQKK